MMKKKTISSIATLAVLALAYLATQFLGGEDAVVTPVRDGSTERMEIPAPGDGTVVEHEAYVSSYNRNTLIPDWVAYELTADEIEGEAARSDKGFSMDPDVRGAQAMREDYAHSGWTKGHMIPASDVRWSRDAMEETFYFTNICPQNEVLNGGDWEYLERKVRAWARKFGSVYVVTGPIVGSGKYGTIGDHDVTVPDAFFKAVATNRMGKWYSIAFVMGNDAERYYLQDCAMSVNDLEALTGLDLFPALDDSIEDEVEAQRSLKDWDI